MLTDPLLQIEIGGLTIERGVEVMIEGNQTVGTWNQTEEGANWPTHPHVAVAGFKNKDGDSSFNNNNNNKTLIVCSIFVINFFLNLNIQTSDSFIFGKQSNPYFMMKESNGSSFFFFVSSPTRSPRCGWDSTTSWKTKKIVEDSAYGSLDEETGEWNSPHPCKHTSSSRSSSRRMLRSILSSGSISTPFRIQQHQLSHSTGLRRNYKVLRFCFKVTAKRISISFVVSLQGDVDPRPEVGRKVGAVLHFRSWSPRCHTARYTWPFIFFFVLTVGLMDSLIKLSWKTWPPSRRKSNTAASDQDQPSHSSVYASHFF